MDELIAGREPLLLNSRGVSWILVAGVSPDHRSTRAFEKAEGGAPPGIEQRLDGRVRMLRRVVDLGHVVHSGHAVVELRQSAE